MGYGFITFQAHLLFIHIPISEDQKSNIIDILKKMLIKAKAENQANEIPEWEAFRDKLREAGDDDFANQVRGQFANAINEGAIKHRRHNVEQLEQKIAQIESIPASHISNADVKDILSIQ